MLKRLSFRSKLLLVLFVPFLALVMVSAAGLRDRFAALRAQEQYGQLEQPLVALHDVSRALEQEAVANQWYVSSGRDPAVPIETLRRETDAAVERFRAAEERFRTADIGPAARDALAKVDSGLIQLDEERRRIERVEVDTVTPPLLLLAIADNTLDFGHEVARSLRDETIGASVVGVVALQQEQGELAREAAAMLPVLATGTDEGFSAWLRAIAAGARYHEQFLATADAADLAVHAATADSFDTTPNLLRPANAATNLPTAFPGTDDRTTPAGYFTAYEERSARQSQAIAAISDAVGQRAREQAATARRDVWVYGGATVLAMLATIALVWIVARAVVRPLRALTRSAREVSQRQLPQLVDVMRAGGEIDTAKLPPVMVDSEDEIGELAQAFNDVQTVTIDVAQEQSRLLRKGMGDLFVNLARRNQSLLERQLELLDELERNEHDPAALDALFKLDHMATRMRRNAESLLVLSGAEQPRQWQDPIALLDVVRAAAAEIADFPRVELVGIDVDLAVAGRAVADVAHLVAELLENATSFSPPDSAVVVSGAATTKGFVLAISDQGIGMPADRVRDANELLARPPAVGLALSRALGLHVVGSLAARHDITVELRPGAPVGLVALVTLPGSILQRRGAPKPSEPVYEPDTGSDGKPEPLGARRLAWRPPDEPPVEEWRREGLAEPRTETTAVAVAAEEPDVPEEEPAEDAPLPTRTPGRHMSHHPAVDTDVPAPGSDPLRPYRVHEFLSRHDQGKRRGRAETDIFQPEGGDEQ